VVKSGRAISDTVILRLVKRRAFELLPNSKAYLKAIPSPVKTRHQINTLDGLLGTSALNTKPLINIKTINKMS
jgi:hypothetical protein